MMTRVLYNHPWMQLLEDKNQEAFVRMGDAVIVVPVTHDQRILFISEKSIAYGSRMLTLPTGGVEPGEVPSVTANRELREETGFMAKNLHLLGTLNPSAKYMHWNCQVYLGYDLIPARLEGDETSKITVHPVPFTSVTRLIGGGRLTDSTAIAAVYMGIQRIRQHMLPL